MEKRKLASVQYVHHITPIEGAVSCMSDFRKYLDEQLKDEEFKKEWEDSECEYQVNY